MADEGASDEDYVVTSARNSNAVLSTSAVHTAMIAGTMRHHSVFETPNVGTERRDRPPPTLRNNGEPGTTDAVWTGHRSRPLPGRNGDYSLFPPQIRT